MSLAVRLSAIGALVLAVSVTVALRHGEPPANDGVVAKAAVPRLLDIGADKCIPCRAMVPVLEELRRDYATQLRVDFIDAWKFPEQAAPYNVYGIPVQIFFDASGRELYRHLGFFSKEEILRTWRALGYSFEVDRRS